MERGILHYPEIEAENRRSPTFLKRFCPTTGHRVFSAGKQSRIERR
jgi:hypothetical protein